ncbi:MAG: hypothetical protein DRP71_08485 [Verrucomicrobia bacterium]|nr:MAG: hypothetical protein DRP71_08485 [Verrucomicrobiota bacterium]
MAGGRRRRIRIGAKIRFDHGLWPAGLGFSCFSKAHVQAPISAQVTGILSREASFERVLC